MSFDRDDGFQNGIGITMLVLAIAVVVFIGGRACQQYTDQQEIRLCQKEGLTCYNRVLGMKGDSNVQD